MKPERAGIPARASGAPRVLARANNMMKLRKSGNGEWERVSSSKPNVRVLGQKAGMQRDEKQMW